METMKSRKSHSDERRQDDAEGDNETELECPSEAESGVLIMLTAYRAVAVRERAIIIARHLGPY